MKKQEYRVIGNPARHSLSPTIHNTLYKIYGIAGKYSFEEITAETLPEFVKRAKDGLCGMNVTMPLKNEIKPFLDVNNAKFSVNTVKIQDGSMHGYSTDEFGFEAALKETGRSMNGSRIVFLGAGAVTKALAFHAKKQGADVCVLNRTVSKARDMAQELGIRYGEFLSEEHLSRADVLVNATPLGMMGRETFEDFGFLDSLKKNAAVFDLNYSPAETRLEHEAAKKSLIAINGLSMLIWQAFGSFNIFFDIMPTEKDKDIITKAIKER